MELGPGTVLLGKYRVDEVLGTGGMGKVLRASHLYLQQSYAIKVLLPHMADSASTVSRFLREAQATVNLKSEHVARVWDVGTMPGSGDTPPTPFIVMEFLEGNDLNQILRHHGPQTPPVVCELMLQACEGMAEAHALGIVHRDIKPSNFFITRRADGTMLLKILDFGISKTPVGITELTGTQTVLGTPTYMAPEQMKTSKTADTRSDIWSLGVVMYQLITGRPPFSGESYAELVLKVNSEVPAPILVPLPPGLGEVILRCLEKNPAMRPQNVGELARQLAPYAPDPISAAQSATRTTRILQHRTAQKGVDALPLTASGGRATPVPIQPAQLTPRSWPPTSSSTSLSQGRGQVTHRVRGGRGWLIAGVSALTIAAGAGGFFASRMIGNDEATPAASSAPPPPASDVSSSPTSGGANGTTTSNTTAGPTADPGSTSGATAGPTANGGSASGATAGPTANGGSASGASTSGASASNASTSGASASGATSSAAAGNGATVTAKSTMSGGTSGATASGAKSTTSGGASGATASGANSGTTGAKSTTSGGASGATASGANSTTSGGASGATTSGAKSTTAGGTNGATASAKSTTASTAKSSTTTAKAKTKATSAKPKSKSTKSKSKQRDDDDDLFDTRK